MQLTRHTDYALRLLIHLAQAGKGRVQIADAARKLAVSATHLTKIAGHLARLGFVEAVRGRGGGVRLARPPAKIGLADVFCATEPGTALVQCAGCTLLTDGCRLPGIFGESFAAFRDVLARYTLADLVEQSRRGQSPV
jgi:Rrf2 family transcriptional regulator, nitric oxide-sensitive transcriptional repressor